MLESVNDYSSCDGVGCSLPPCFNPGDSNANANASATAFWNQLSSTNTLGFTHAGAWQDGNVYDTDFLDPETYQANSNDNDTWNFDVAGYAISFYQGHGIGLGNQTSQVCTSGSNCNNPPAPTTVGTTGYGSCVITPPTVSTYGAGKGTCWYTFTPAIATCSKSDSNNHLAELSPNMAFGENPSVGAWAGAGTNGGTALAIVHISGGLFPWFPITEWSPVFAGLQIFAGVMATSGDVGDSSQFGDKVAAPYTANPSSHVIPSFTDAISSITDGSGCPGSGFSYVGGINGCGCHVALTFSSTNASATAIYNEAWSALQSTNSSQTGRSYWYYRANCNYNPTTYPWTNGL